MLPETYSVSVRNKTADQSIIKFIERSFPIGIDQIDSVFGFAEECTLYGGRVFTTPQLSDGDIKTLNDLGIGFRIPLTNHFDTFDKSREFLDRYDNGINSVIVTNDEVAKKIRANYGYRIEASVIKELRTLDDINAALNLYDSVVPPMDLNDDLELLESLPKEKIRLFVNSWCAYTCPSKICYRSFSKINAGKGGEQLCSMGLKDRPFIGMHQFNVAQLKEMGFTKFKMLVNK